MDDVCQDEIGSNLADIVTQIAQDVSFVLIYLLFCAFHTHTHRVAYSFTLIFSNFNLLHAGRYAFILFSGPHFIRLQSFEDVKSQIRFKRQKPGS